MRADRLKEHVAKFYRIGPRNIGHYENLCRAQDHITHTLRRNFGPVRLHGYKVKGKEFFNVISEIKGTEKPEEIIILGAHYDTYKDSPGSNNNASALAVLFEIGSYFKNRPIKRTLRIVTFTNEEKPFTQTDNMGSLVYAKFCKRMKENIITMICLDNLGSLKSKLGSSSSDFIEVIANSESKHISKQIVPKLQHHVPVDHSFFSSLLSGVRNSDHWSFWKVGYPAVMLTDVSPLHQNFYNHSKDTPDDMDYDWLTKVCNGVQESIESFLFQ